MRTVRKEEGPFEDFRDELIQHYTARTNGVHGSIHCLDSGHLDGVVVSCRRLTGNGLDCHLRCAVLNRPFQVLRSSRVSIPWSPLQRVRMLVGSTGDGFGCMHPVGLGLFSLGKKSKFHEGFKVEEREHHAKQALDCDDV